MSFTAIVAMAQNRAIGKNNQLLWHLPDDLRHFKQLTLQKPVLMGRKTHESIGRPLPQRTNIVLSRQRDWTAEGCVTVHSIEEIQAIAAEHAEIFVIGGASLYALLLPFTTRIHLTLVEAVFDADTFFPDINLSEWDASDPVLHPADAQHATPFRFITLNRKR